MRKTGRKLQFKSEHLRHLSPETLPAAKGGNQGYTQWGCTLVSCVSACFTHCASCYPYCDSCNYC